MNKTNYDKVREFNAVFGSPVYKQYKHELWENKKIIKLRLDLIKEEVRELEDALENNDIIETMDALGDILVVTYGALDAFGINGDKVFDEVHLSNMSKLCNTEQEAIESVEWYKTNNKIYDSPTYRYCNKQDKYIIYNSSSGKILKNQSINNSWAEPDFTNINNYNK